MRFAFAFLTVIAIYMSPMFFSEMSFAYLAEAAIKSGFIVAVCDWCRKEFKEMAFIIAIEFFMCLVCAIIALRWQPGMISAEILITDLSNLAIAVELLILLSMGVGIALRSGYSINYNRRRDDVHRDNHMEVAA